MIVLHSLAFLSSVSIKLKDVDSSNALEGIPYFGLHLSYFPYNYDSQLKLILISIGKEYFFSDANFGVFDEIEVGTKMSSFDDSS